jgi:hypothetical protein
MDAQTMSSELRIATDPRLMDGRQSETAAAVAQGARRLLRSIGVATICELVLGNGRRADIAGLTADGTIHIVEIKSSLQDLRSDNKWPEYADYCDHFYFAAPPELDPDIFPQEPGFIVADNYGAEILRPAPLRKMLPARRRITMLAFAQQAANRLHSLQDPSI